MQRYECRAPFFQAEYEGRVSPSKSEKIQYRTLHWKPPSCKHTIQSPAYLHRSCTEVFGHEQYRENLAASRQAQVKARFEMKKAAKEREMAKTMKPRTNVSQMIDFQSWDHRSSNLILVFRNREEEHFPSPSNKLGVGAPTSALRPFSLMTWKLLHACKEVLYVQHLSYAR